MPLQTMLKCDRCSKTTDVNGTVDQSTLNAQGFGGWKMVLGKLLCPDCLEAVQTLVGQKAAPKRDSGFTDGRPVGGK